ncbi:uncharacterized protein METZ01_LOCUS500789, partial [marine metagenome]
VAYFVATARMVSLVLSKCAPPNRLIKACVLPASLGLCDDGSNIESRLHFSLVCRLFGGHCAVHPEPWPGTIKLGQY